jgi:hypothetical protein
MTLGDRVTEILNLIPCAFPRESRNSRRGSDVPRGRESKGVPSLKFPRSILEILSRILDRSKKRGSNGYEVEP